MEGYKLKDLKLKEFDSIQEMFDRAFKRVNTFEDFRTELVEGKEKRAGTELTQKIGKKQKVEDDKEIAELKQCLKIIPDKEEVTIDAIPLAVNHMLKSFDREDLEDLYKLVKAKYESTRPMEGLDLILWGDLKTMFEPHVEDAMLVEKKYPLAPLTLSMMLEKKLNIDYESKMAYQLLKFIIKQFKKLVLTLSDRHPTYHETPSDQIDMAYSEALDTVYQPFCMKRSSTKELLMPFKEPEREFRSSRKLFKTLSLDESRSPEYNLFSDLEENFEEEVADIMAENMEQYMSKTRADYGSGIARPKINDKDHFELKGQFIKELRDNTFCGSDHEDANEDIEKVLDIVDLFHVPNITQDQIMLRVFLMSLTGVSSRWLRNKLAGVIPTKTTADAKVSIQKMAKYSKKWHNGTSRTRSTETSNGLAAIQAQLNNLGREIKKLNEKGDIEQQLQDSTKEIMLILRIKNEDNQWKNYYENLNQGASIKILEIQIGQMSKVLQEKGFGSLPSSTETKPRDHAKSISTTIKADMTPIRHIESSQYTVLAQQNTSHIDNFIPQKEKDPGSFTLPCYISNVCFDNALAELGARLSVMPLSTYLNLGLGELAHTKLMVELADRTVKYPKGIPENVLVWIGKFVFPIDFIILDMPEDVKVSLILDVFKRKITLRAWDEKNIFKSMKHASSLFKRVYMLGLRERMKLDLEARLMGETLVLNRSLDPLYGDYIKLNDLNVPLELRRDQVDDLMPTIEEVMENMDGYRDQDMGDVILGEPFSKASCVEARRIPEIGFCMFFLYFAHDIAGKEIDKVGEVSIIWNPMCVVVMLVVRYKEFGELIQPFKDLERVSQLDRKLLNTNGLDCLSFLGTRPHY
ncbi:zf-CCHC domain-containing protein [Tanacetum coccineum]